MKIPNLFLMLQLDENRLLRELTTFKIGGPAKYFLDASSLDELRAAIEHARSNGFSLLLLGGGSNMLASDSGFDGLVIRINNKGIAEVERDADSVTIKIGSGEVWDDVVHYAVQHEFWGIENMSRIPGRTGALAVQNVGAYGAEASQVLVNVDVFDRVTNESRTFSNQECKFSYRKSIFNTTAKGRYVILSTTLRLSKIPKPNIAYPDLKKHFEGVSAPLLKDIRDAIKEIRDSKFPYPAESVEGNAGSFFKNASLSEKEYANLEERFRENIPDRLSHLQSLRNKFPMPNGIKIPTAFILEACDLKRYVVGNVMLNPNQPVVVLNWTGNATADEVLRLVQHVRAVVKERTGLHLYTEPELIGFSEKELRGYGFIQSEIDRYCPR